MKAPMLKQPEFEKENPSKVDEIADGVAFEKEKASKVDEIADVNAASI